MNTVKVTINGISVEVPEDATVLDAAMKAGMKVEDFEKLLTL